MERKKPRRVKFAELYAQYGNGTRAAKEAGYSPRSAHSQASRLLRDRKVRDMIAGHAVNRHVHADQTYRDLIRVAEAAMEHMRMVLNDVDAHYDVRSRAILSCGKQLETLAKCEGLLLPEIGRESSAAINLQVLIQNFKQTVIQQGAKNLISMKPAPKLGKNGGTNGHGKPWQSITDEECGKQQEDEDEKSDS